MELFWIFLRPLVEIVVIWFLIYYCIRFFQGTRALQILFGLIFLAAIFNIARFLELNTINWVLTKVFAFGVVAILIIFQPELRRALARMGQNTLWSGFLKKGGTIDEVIQAAEHLSRNRVGALIAIEREVGLKTYIESGIQLDSHVGAELLITLFTPNTPTHDGAIIIVGDRIASCGSLFPLSQDSTLARSLGTRHRAAVGITDESDAVCVVVSEETGTISVAVYGKLTRDLDGDHLRRVLESLFKRPQTKKGVREFLESNWNLFRKRAAK